MNWPEPDLTRAVPADDVGLFEGAQREILRTFNSLTNAYATVAEYIAYQFPGSEVWAGDACGCTDDRCAGHHHDVGAPCGCLDVQLDEFHDDLAVAYRVRSWLATRADQADVLAALRTLRDHPRDFDTRLDAAQKAAIAELLTSADYLDPGDYSRALHRVGIDCLAVA